MNGWRGLESQCDGMRWTMSGWNDEGWGEDCGGLGARVEELGRDFGHRDLLSWRGKGFQGYERNM